MEELRCPFRDPRPYRTEKNKIPLTDLFYMLIEESKRTFKKGVIVTATVIQPLPSKAKCRLDNGLTAFILSSDFQEGGSSRDKQEEWTRKMNHGKIIQGRIDIIRLENEDRFEVQLKCNKAVLQSHEHYKEDLARGMGFRPDQVLEADLKNHNFSAEQRPQTQGRFNPRSIAHEKFKNISSRRAISELN